MNRQGRHAGLLAAGFILVLALTYLSAVPGRLNSYPWLLLPLIMLGGYLEGLTGAIGITLAASAAAAVAGLLGMETREAASIEILAFTLACGATALFVFKFEAEQRTRTSILLPQEAKLTQVERKVHLIRGQIEENETHLHSLYQVYEAAKKLVGFLELGALLDEARTLVARTLQGHFGTQAVHDSRLGFYVPDDYSSGFQRVDARGHEVSDEGLPARLELAVLQQWTGESFNPVKVRDLAQDERFRTAGGLTAFASLLVIPLVMHESLSGVMLLACEDENAFAAADFNQASLLGKQIVFALRKALLYRRVQQLSITDNLTGLFVHRHFQERFQEELGRAERYRHPVGLIMLDLDNFKLVNDEHGHVVGDAVLAEAAARIREAAGATALVARYGGEEFAILLPGASKAKALETAQAVNEGLKATPIDIGGAHLTVTVSGGVTAYPEDAPTRDALISAADLALYAAKHAGRDQIAGYTRSPEEKNI
jgi:diguanylate cyclase (GGDEF)-like protein